MSVRPWQQADLAMDDYRIGRDDLRCGGRSERCEAHSDFTSMGHNVSTGDDSETETSDRYAVRKAKLLVNFKYMWETHGLLWPQQARVVR